METPIWKKYCIGKGLEIGGASYRRFGLDTINMDIKDEKYPLYEKTQMAHKGEVLRVDMIADASDIPLPDNSVPFVIASHVLEHVFDPISTLIEWTRIVRPGGVIFMIIPHKERTFDAPNPRTTLAHLIEDYKNPIKTKGDLGHAHIWITCDITELIAYMEVELKMPWKVEEIEDTDSHSGDGFTFVIRKRGEQ